MKCAFTAFSFGVMLATTGLFANAQGMGMHGGGTSRAQTSAQGGSAAGQAVYQSSCAVCHGPGGKGALPGVPDLSDPKGPIAQSDEVLKKRIREGFQSPGSPMAMPPKGGNSDLTENNIANVVRYMRTTFKR